MPISQIVTPGVHTPKVSVIIGNYNQGRFAGDAIRSVAAQTYDNLECVIVDDASTDNSRELIEAALTELGDDRFRFIPRDANGGQMAAMLTGFDATDGPFVAFVDADDVWHPHFLENHVAANLSTAGTAAISCSEMALIDESGAVIVSENPMTENWTRELNFMRPKYRQFVNDGADRLVFVDPKANGWLWTATSAMVFRRAAIATLRPMAPEKIRIQADSYWAYSAHMLGGTVRLERPLGYYRLHGKNSWANSGYLGKGSIIGDENPEVASTIQQEVVRTFCAVAPGLGRTLERPKLARAFANYIGWPQAIRLHDRNADARTLLTGWVTIERRVWTILSTILPSGLRPKQVVIKRRQFTVTRDDVSRNGGKSASQGKGLDRKFVRSVYGPYLLDTPNDRTFELCVTGYGQLLSDAIKSHDRDFLFLDIGANCGVFSLLAAEQPRCRKVIAIEPVPETFNRLEANIAYNKADKIEAIRGAVSDSKRTRVHLTYNPRHSGMASIAAKSAKDTVRAPAINAYALSKLVNGPNTSILAKIDVEGSETQVLSVLRNTQFFPSISDILIELSERHSGNDGVRSIGQILSEEGFEEIGREGPAEHYDAHYRRKSVTT